MESIHSLSLKNLELTELGCIGECTGLQRLDLSYNSLTRLHLLVGLDSLQTLNLAANKITSLEGLQALENLENLNIAGNLIGGVDALRCLTGLEKLQCLRLRDQTTGLSNPVCLNIRYVADVCSMFPHLTTLDGERINGRGSEVFQMFKQINDAVACRSNETESTHYAIEEWVPASFWEPSTKFDKSLMGDAQQQLEDLLKSCQRLSSAADEKLKQLSIT